MAHVRRGLVAISLIVAGLTFIGTGGGSSDTTTTVVTTTVATTTTVSSTSTTSSTIPTSTTIPPTTTTTLPRVLDPFHLPALATYLRGRTNEVTAALYDVTTGQTFVYNGGVQEVTASMVKIDILAALLHQYQVQHESLPARDLPLATDMVEESDNDDAQALYLQIGQLPGIEAFNDLLGYDQTTANWDWGFTQTTPYDELKLLKAIVFPNRVLSTASRNYEQSLMQNVVSWERFGLPTGVPARATVGLKNGWYPEKATGWQVNTSGYVHYRHCYYLAAVMTAHNPDEAYGLDTVDMVSQDLWNILSDDARR